jgi:hypothetical protein
MHRLWDTIKICFAGLIYSVGVFVHVFGCYTALHKLCSRHLASCSFERWGMGKEATVGYFKVVWTGRGISRKIWGQPEICLHSIRILQSANGKRYRRVSSPARSTLYCTNNAFQRFSWKHKYGTVMDSNYWCNFIDVKWLLKRNLKQGGSEIRGRYYKVYTRVSWREWTLFVLNSNTIHCSIVGANHIESTKL